MVVMYICVKGIDFTSISTIIFCHRSAVMTFSVFQLIIQVRGTEQLQFTMNLSL